MWVDFPLFRRRLIFLSDLTVRKFCQCLMLHELLLPLFFHILRTRTANSLRKREKERARLSSHEFRKGSVFSLFILFPGARQGGRRFWKVELIVLIIQGFLWSSLQFMTWLLSGRRKWNRMGRMMNSVFKCLMSVACAVALPALGQEEKAGFPTDRAVTVFSAGEGNPYASIRIPALLQIGKGQLLAFAEGRYKNTDQGKTILS